MSFAPTPDALETTFIDAISRGWGLRINCRQCAEYRAWSDKELARRFLPQLDQSMSVLKGRVKCPKCGDKDKLVIYPFNSGAMDWRPFSIAQSDLPAAIEAHKAEVREMAAAQEARRQSQQVGVTLRLRRASSPRAFP